ncbi:MAG: LysR substrate-binding domain-containing protein, partial [Myxococcota bacterium]
TSRRVRLCNRGPCDNSSSSTEGWRAKNVAKRSRLHSLTRREVDVVLRVSRQPDETLVGRRVIPLQYAVFANDALETHRPFDPGKLPWIGWDPAMFARVSDAWFAANTAPGSVRARVTSTVAMLDLAKSGIGACIVPTLYGKLSGLNQLTPPLDGFETWIWCLTHRDLSRNARVRAFTEHIVSGLRSAVAEAS